MIDALEALRRLRDGNRRFARDVRDGSLRANAAHRVRLVEGQAPFAVVLGCSDSRVPVELVFDQGLGDLFVIRVAGNIVAPSQVASAEFAAETFGTRLVVVLGHTLCGAVTATLAGMDAGDDDQPDDPPGDAPRLESITSRIRPALRGLPAGGAGTDDEARLDAAIRANVLASADHLRHDSPLLARLIADDGLLVVGAVYSLESGEVDFFDGVPPVA